MLDHHRRQLTALNFGAIDMHDVLETARYLRGEYADAEDHASGMPWRARRILEVGLFVVYARPFTRSEGLERLRRAAGLSDELRATHDEILERRRKFYAHADDTQHRRILELDADDWSSVLDPSSTLSEQWSAPTPELLDDVIQLAAAHLSAFIDRIERLRPFLRAPLSASSTPFD